MNNRKDSLVSLLTVYKSKLIKDSLIDLSHMENIRIQFYFSQKTKVRPHYYSIVVIMLKLALESIKSDYEVTLHSI